MVASTVLAFEAVGLAADRPLGPVDGRCEAAGDEVARSDIAVAEEVAGIARIGTDRRFRFLNRTVARPAVLSARACSS